MECLLKILYRSDTQLFRADSMLAQMLLLLLQEFQWFPVAYWITPKLPGLSFQDPLAPSFMVLPTAVDKLSH